MDVIKEFKADELKVKVLENRNKMGKSAASAAAEKIRACIRKKNECNIIFAAAPSQNELLEFLMKFEDIEWEKINAFHMDEYIGLDENAPQRFGNFLREKIFNHKPFKSINYIDGNAQDIDNECNRYTELLKKYPADIVCMGIGENGHIAFNDPHVADFNDDKLVKVVELDEKCRNQQVNDGCFQSISDVPKQAVTLTIPALTKAESLICTVPAATKAEAVRNMVFGEISVSCPASVLRLHNNAVMFTDSDSGKHLL